MYGGNPRKDNIKSLRIPRLISLSFAAPTDATIHKGNRRLSPDHLCPREERKRHRVQTVLPHIPAVRIFWIFKFKIKIIYNSSEQNSTHTCL
jgi:hypothetical protein